MSISENEREVVVTQRQYGKTTELFSEALKRMRRGEKVLFCCANQLILNDTADFLLRDIPGHYIYNKSEKIIKSIHYDGIIKFITYDYMKGISYNPSTFRDYFKIIDNIGFILGNFDLYSITGELRKTDIQRGFEKE